jgi:hypothetical protein
LLFFEDLIQVLNFFCGGWLVKVKSHLENDVNLITFFVLDYFVLQVINNARKIPLFLQALFKDLVCFLINSNNVDSRKQLPHFVIFHQVDSDDLEVKLVKLALINNLLFLHESTLLVLALATVLYDIVLRV